MSHWLQDFGNFPYRASVRNDSEWGSNLPSPHMAGAWKRFRARTVLGFELEEVRDYFVEGHAFQGAKREKNYADAPTPLAPKTKKHRPPSNMDEAKLAYFHAAVDRRRALEAMEAVFVRDIESHFKHGNLEEGVEIINSMPGNSVAKSIAITRLMESGLWDRSTQKLSDYPAAPLTPVRAGVMHMELKAENRFKRAEQDLEDIAVPMFDEYLENNDRDRMEKLRDMLPNGMMKATVVDALRFRMPQDNAGPRL